jgi:hypothetical protein
MGITKATGALGNPVCLVGTAEQMADAILRYYRLGISSFLIRGFDPVGNTIEFGRELIPVSRPVRSISTSAQSPVCRLRRRRIAPVRISELPSLQWTRRSRGPVHLFRLAGTSARLAFVRVAVLCIRIDCLQCPDRPTPVAVDDGRDIEILAQELVRPEPDGAAR